MTNIFTPVWHKYRPVILKMMIDASQEEQHYQLSNHEFKALNPRQKSGFAFTLKMRNGKAETDSKGPSVAHDLWDILKISPKATELLSEASFEIVMDKNFVLHVQKLV